MILWYPESLMISSLISPYQYNTDILCLCFGTFASSQNEWCFECWVNITPECMLVQISTIFHDHTALTVFSIEVIARIIMTIFITFKFQHLEIFLLHGHVNSFMNSNSILVPSLLKVVYMSWIITQHDLVYLDTVLIELLAFIYTSHTTEHKI